MADLYSAARGAANARLFEAAGNNANPAVIAALIVGNADPNARSVIGETALQEAAAHSGRAAHVAALIDGGIDPDAQDQLGSIPLHLGSRAAWSPPS